MKRICEHGRWAIVLDFDGVRLANEIYGGPKLDGKADFLDLLVVIAEALATLSDSAFEKQPADKQW